MCCRLLHCVLPSAVLCGAMLCVLHALGSLGPRSSKVEGLLCVIWLQDMVLAAVERHCCDELAVCHLGALCLWGTEGMVWKTRPRWPGSVISRDKLRSCCLAQSLPQVWLWHDSMTPASARDEQPAQGRA